MSTSVRSPVLSAASATERFEAAVAARRNWLAALPVAVACLDLPARPALAAFATGAAFVSLGVALRAWATLHNRYAQGERKTLATGGPYSWLRNPLYLANTAVMLGGVAAAGSAAPLRLTAAALWCALVYGTTVRCEERRLHEKYGARYAAYSACVGRWWPRRAGEVPRFGARAFLGACLAQAGSFAILLPALLPLAR